MGRDDLTVEAFRSRAVTYDKTVSRELERFAGVTHREVLDQLLGRVRVKDGGLVLDVGTGTGSAAIRCALETKEVQIVGLDRTLEMLNQAACNAEAAAVQARTRWVLASATNLPYPDEHFEVVFSSLALHHTRVRRSLEEMRRVAKSGARIAIADMGAPSAWRSAPISWLMSLLLWIYRLVGGTQARAEAETFEQTYTAGEWHALLDATGLQNVDVKTILRPGQRIYPCVIVASGDKG
jgi:ubiquinone/menaquinone biosynthesis C-methylase UbiE